MSLYDLFAPAFLQMLRTLAAQLDKAEAHAATAKFDMAVLLSARLAPDMFPLAEQIRFVCMQAIGPVDRLAKADRPAPDLSGAELHQLRAHLDATIAYVEGASANEINASADAAIELALPNGMTFDMTGWTYIRDWAQPQFYFHLVTAYAIMRHNGVDLGKADYVPHMMKYLRQPS